MFAPQKSQLRVVLPVLLLGSLVSCDALRPAEESSPFTGSPQLLARLQPGDIAVAPILDQTGGADVPAAEIRAGFADALVQRLYSPLDNEYVDANWVESSFGGTPGPDALLVIALTSWDPSHLFSNGEVTGAAEVVLFEGGSTAGTPLWSETRELTVSLADGRGTPPTPSDSLEWRAASAFAREFLATLPARDPLAAHD